MGAVRFTLLGLYYRHQGWLRRYSSSGAPVQILSVLIALIDIIFTGVIVTRAINATNIANSKMIEAVDVRARVEV